LYKCYNRKNVSADSFSTHALFCCLLLGEMS